MNAAHRYIAAQKRKGGVMPSLRAELAVAALRTQVGLADGATEYVPITLAYAITWKLSTSARRIMAGHEVKMYRQGKANHTHVWQRLTHPNLP